MTYELPDYAAMLSDPVRGPAYFAAVRASVHPGSVVADIGAGTGVLGVYAAILGARRVFLLEPYLAIGAAVELARENGVLDRIEIIRDLSTRVTLSERANVIVSDLRGVIPLYERHLEAAIDMRERHLAPGGICIPVRDRLYTALVDDPALHARTVGAWAPLPPDIKHGSLTKLFANRWFRTHATSDQLLTSPVAWATIEYGQPAPVFDSSWNTEARRDGTVHGVLLWFDADLTESIAISNAPSAPRALYGQAMFPYLEPIAIRAGDQLSSRLRAVLTGDEYEWLWSLHVTRAGQAVAEVRHTSLQGTPFIAEALARRSESYVPQLAADTEILRTILESVDGVRDLAAIAELIQRRYPDTFATTRDALRFVTRHEDLWM